LAKSRTILVVEDMGPIRAVMRIALETEGYSVLEASNGNEALAVAGKNADSIDLLVSDNWLPGLMGSVVAERLREANPALKVLLISGAEIPVRAGFEHLRKPFLPSELVRKVKEIMG
jgi:two-component system cell cycle sensor histidine kinase/response regulator CckA